MGSIDPVMEYYRSDGVRITHDPYHPDMAEKYGKPGETDSEGFDPYADSVGPGIYGGIIKRDEHGEVVIGAQYQNHNPRPGPVYAGGGYTPINKALDDSDKLTDLLEKYPDLVNDISTGGAQPLHMCGMSKRKQHAVNILVAAGGDVEAVDTYGFTPLLRMASNNLAVGARSLLESGADPGYKGNAGLTPMQCAMSSRAVDVVRLLQEWGPHRKDTRIERIRVAGAGVVDVNGDYVRTSCEEIPKGFDKVCKEQKWNTENMWRRLNSDNYWFKAENDAYIYWNTTDECWWIDHPDGSGAYKAKAPCWAPPQSGWKPLCGNSKHPLMVATFRKFINKK